MLRHIVKLKLTDVSEGHTVSIIRTMTEAVHTFEMSVNFNVTTQCYIPEVSKHHSQSSLNKILLTCSWLRMKAVWSIFLETTYSFSHANIFFWLAVLCHGWSFPFDLNIEQTLVTINSIVMYSSIYIWVLLRRLMDYSLILSYKELFVITVRETTEITLETTVIY
jgi:hypothetical protein